MSAGIVVVMPGACDGAANDAGPAITPASMQIATTKRMKTLEVTPNDRTVGGVGQFEAGAGSIFPFRAVQEISGMPSALATFALLVMAAAAGVAIAVQQVVNAGFRNAVGSAWWAGLASYVGGTLFMVAALLVTRERVPSLLMLKQVPAASWFGGALGGIRWHLAEYSRHGSVVDFPV